MSRKIEFNDVSVPAELGDTVSLQHQENLEVVKCQETGVLMLNIDADQLQVGDLRFIKKLGLTISNPNTDKPVALGVDFEESTFGEKIRDFFASDTDDDDDDDSSFFESSYRSGGSSFGSFGGFGGGSSFGGFGGGGFSGGGAARGF